MISGNRSETLTGLVIEGDYSMTAGAADLIPHIMQMEQPWIRSFEDISAFLADADSELDIDGNGESKALSDGLLLIHYLFGFTGDALKVGAIGEGAKRDTSEAIEAYISDRVPASE